MKPVLAFIGSRAFQFTALPAAVFLWFWLTDPSGGADTLLRLQLWAQAILVTGVAYLIAKAMLGRASSEALYDQALQGNTGAGVAYAGVCLMRALVLLALLAFFATIQR